MANIKVTETILRDAHQSLIATRLKTEEMVPILEDLDKDVDGLAKVGKLDVDEEYEVADQFGIMSIPTLIVFKDGKVHQSTIGVQSKETLRKLLEV